MSTTKLVIRKKRVNNLGKTPVFVQYCYKQKTKLFSTNQKVDPNNWDEENSKITFGESNHRNLNILINKKKNEIDAIVHKAIFDNKEPDFEYIKSELSKNENTTATSADMFTLIDNYINDLKSIIVEGTIKQYNSFKSTLEDYKDHLGLETISLEQVDNKFYKKFKDYLIEEKKLSDNTIRNKIKVLKSILYYAEDEKLDVKVDIKKIKKPKEIKKDIIFLTMEELNHLYNYELKDEFSNQVRDIFIFGCATGLRYSDIYALKRENIYPNDIRLLTIKDTDNLHIPLNKYSRAILEKYEHLKDTPLPRIPDYEFNKHLKHVCFTVGFCEDILVYKKSGSHVTKKTKKRHDLITSHTMRRTFATLSIALGMHPMVVMKKLGQSDFRTMQRYIEINNKMGQEEMEKAWG